MSNTKFQIVVADKGWIFIGDTEQTADGIIIHNAKNIRRWGTEAGLGQLAKSGATDETELDEYGTVKIPLHSVIFTIEVDEKNWKPQTA